MWAFAGDCDNGGPCDKLWKLGDLRQATWTWTQILPASAEQPWPPARNMHAMVALGSQIYVHGGQDLNGLTLSDIWVFDVRDGCVHQTAR